MQNALRDDALLGLENKNAVFYTPEEKAQRKAQQKAQQEAQRKAAPVLAEGDRMEGGILVKKGQRLLTPEERAIIAGGGGRMVREPGGRWRMEGSTGLNDGNTVAMFNNAQGGGGGGGGGKGGEGGKGASTGVNKGVRLDGSTAVRARLIRFCSKYDRDKLDYVDGLLRKYAGKWETMFTLLVDQYGL